MIRYSQSKISLLNGQFPFPATIVQSFNPLCTMVDSRKLTNIVDYALRKMTIVQAFH